MTESRIILGLQPVREAIRVHGGALHRVLVAKTDNPRVSAVGRFARDQGVEVEELPKARIDKLAKGVHHQGVAAMADPLALLDLATTDLVDDELFVMLDGITDPQNFGAIIRSVVGLGGTGIIWGEHHSAPLTPSTFRASAGAVEHARLFQVTALRGAITSLTERGITTLALDADSDRALTDVDLTGPVALVVGAEDKGVRRGVRNVCSATARLPMSGRIGSLNASVASAIAVYEVLRQRTRKPVVSDS